MSSSEIDASSSLLESYPQFMLLYLLKDAILKVDANVLDRDDQARRSHVRLSRLVQVYGVRMK